MAHVRTQIRDQVVTVLTGLTLTGSRIYPSRFYPLEDSELPGLCVYTDGEEIEPVETGSTVQERNIFLKVEGYAKESTDIDDTLDDISADVETALLADQFLSNTARGTDLESVEKDLTVIGEQPAGVVTMNFVVKAMTVSGSPETALA